jgi:hypothetical protein
VRVAVVDDVVGLVDLTAPDGPLRGPVRREGWSRRRRAVTGAVIAAVLAAGGLAAHVRADPIAARLPSAGLPSSADYSAAAGQALQLIAPHLRVDWRVGDVAWSGSAADPPVDLQVSARVTGFPSPAGPRVGYRVIDLLPARATAQPCLLPALRLGEWAYAQGGDAALPCTVRAARRLPAANAPGGPAHWAVREATAPATGGSGPVVVREVTLVRSGWACSVAEWEVGAQLPLPMTTEQLQRVALAVDRVRSVAQSGDRGA